MEQKRDFSIVGTMFRPGAWHFVGKLDPRVALTVKRQPANKYDKNACAIYWGGKQLGWIPAAFAAEIAPLMDKGMVPACRRAVTKHRRAMPGVLTLIWDDGKPVPEKTA